MMDDDDEEDDTSLPSLYVCVWMDGGKAGQLCAEQQHRAGADDSDDANEGRNTYIPIEHSSAVLSIEMMSKVIYQDQHLFHADVRG